MKTTTTTRLPSVERLLHMASSMRLLSEFGHEALADKLRAELNILRDIWLATGERPSDNLILADVAKNLNRMTIPSLQRAINATGIILHTGLGRSVLCAEAIRRIAEIAEGHGTLELDLETGERGSRNAHVESRLCALTGTEAAIVVNNDAGAVLLALAATAAGREVIVSRGELVEIGGGFRIPEVMTQSGARLVEVGTTNKTRAVDYERAITANTAALLTVHPSNFRVVGFTETPLLSDIATVARKHVIPLLDDLGSGALVNVRDAGLPNEPSVQERLAAGADVVLFSGDKLLGGPQAGILVGSETVIKPMRTHPLARALRCDKITLTALEVTLMVYQRGTAWSEIPTLRALAQSQESLRNTAERLSGMIEAGGVPATVTPSMARIGAGSAPGQELPSFAVAVSASGCGPNEAATKLRQAHPPVVARVTDDRLLLDMRTLLPGEVELVAQLVIQTLGKEQK